MDRSRGFTLLELIIVTGIVAVLAALATASYGRYALRAHRADAHRMLMTIAHAEERWYATYNRYTDDLSKFGYDNPGISPHAYYEVALAVSGTTAQAYVVTAMPINSQAADVCGSLSIDNKGNKTPERNDEVANANGRCW
ncbi:type 4 fimbrial biogenesis protein PilE [Dyella lipolytica]|uniref:Prepilin-type N-terminal cleavage/methylation domain-containing protein n=1 Tax=Dyella lipolytica TaxID=1867835 RepID=A0ABW8IWM8_9GAMM|nr:type IV pilin protein [Dyella lipolytica]GLQ46402.1 type 4 fimbrial biogenesis protein PilE [Dyella lipolytica]